jgi:hypothetical protein
MIRRTLLPLAGAALLLGMLSAPAAAAPMSLPALDAFTAEQGMVQPARSMTRRWRCVRRGRCVTPCRGQICRRACFANFRQCRRSLR